MAEVHSWSGTLFLGEGWMVYAGPLGSTASHAHHAVQVVSSALGVAVVDDRGTRFAGASIVVPANTEHRLDAGGEDAAVAYLDPLRLDLPHPGVEVRSDLPAPPTLLGGLDVASRWADETARACGGRARSTSSELVDAVMDETRRRLPATVRLSDVAASLGAATSTLTHRFTAEVGIPFRRWVLWERLQVAAEAVRRGGNLTAAAHSSGFADSAHLNRTFRRMFGITPSEVAGVVRWEVEIRPDRSSR